MDYSDLIIEMYENDNLDDWYDKASPAQQNIIDEIIAREQLSEEEFQELIDDPQYYIGREEEMQKG